MFNVHRPTERSIVDRIITKCRVGLAEDDQNLFRHYARLVIIGRAQIPMKILLRALVYIDRVKPELVDKNKRKDVIYTVFDGALMLAGTVC